MAFALPAGADAANFEVNALSDTGSGGCDVTECTLREAIVAANGDGEASAIGFSVAGTIAPLTALPEVSAAVTIDASTAPGASPGSPTVEINGTNVPAAAALYLRSASTIRGLRIKDFTTGFGIYVWINGGSGSIIQGNVIGAAPTTGYANRYGIAVSGSSNVKIGGPDPADRNIIHGSERTDVLVSSAAGYIPSGVRIQGNRIGTSGSPTEPRRSGKAIEVLKATSTLIGGSGPGEGNVISGARQDGIYLDDQSGTQIINNLIGTSPDGSTAIPNSQYGIRILRSASGPVITGNTIANNISGGVMISNSHASGIGATGIDLSRNSFHSNSGLAIDLHAPLGINQNDPGDGDTGSNDLQNYPELTAAAYDETGSLVTGTLDSTPETEFRLSFYANPVCDQSGNGEGKFWLGEEQVTTDEEGKADFEVDLPALPPDSLQITSLATAPNGSSSEFSPCREALDAADPAPPDFRVTSTADAGSGSLREAIGEANQDSSPDTITFATTGTIILGSPLPPITTPVTIDGLSAPGATPTARQIGIRGTNQTGAIGLDIRAPSTILGISVNSFFSGTGIRFGPEADGSVLKSSIVGSDIPGNSSGFGNVTGVEVLASDVILGGPAAGAGNIISGNSGDGVRIEAPGADLLGNRIGLRAANDFPVSNQTGVRIIEGANGTDLKWNLIGGNSGDGLRATDVDDLLLVSNAVGSNLAGSAANIPNATGIRLERVEGAEFGFNTVARNTGDGIRLEDVRSIEGEADSITANGGDGISVSGTSEGVDFDGKIDANGGLGIDLGDDGVTGNDSLDADTGPNGLQNHPVINSAVYDAHQVVVSGSLHSTPQAFHTVRIYASSTCDPSGFGEGELPRGATTVFTDESGNAGFSLTLGALPPNRMVLTASAVTQPLAGPGSVSEFGNCRTATPAPPSFEVKSLADDGDGTCDSTCTLRDAILTSNQNLSEKTITFAVAGKITPASGLPALQTPVTIDGLSAPGSAPGAPGIEINGFNAGTAPGLTVGARATIRNLLLTGFNQSSAIRIDGGGQGSVLTGNLIGDSRPAAIRNQRGISSSADNVVIGGTGAEDRNVIVGSDIDNILINGGAGTIIQGNLIGLSPAADDRPQASEAGIKILGPADRTRIGGAAPGAGNVISGTSGWGMRIIGASRTESAGNLFGVAADGVTPAANARGGLSLEDGTTGMVSTGDTIAYNGGPGIRVEGTAIANDFAGSSIHSNAGLGIDLNADGVTWNDAGDADTGPNGLQNFPVIKSAGAIEGGIRVAGEVDMQVPGGLAIDFYASAACDPSGQGEGGRFLGTLAQYFPEAGVQKFTFDLGYPDTTLRQITATATGTDGTSEFSACVAATGFDPVVPIEPPDRVKAIPRNGKTLVADPEAGNVTVTRPNGVTESLTEETLIPVGSKIAVLKGKVALTSANPGDAAYQTASFYGGSFRVTQKRGERLVNLRLTGGEKRSAVCKGRNSDSNRVLRKLWGSGKGRFKTKGNRGSAGVRGTIWLTADRCDGTLFSVRDGVVEVRDFGAKKTVFLRRGESYLARSR